MKRRLLLWLGMSGGSFALVVLILHTLRGAENAPSRLITTASRSELGSVLPPRSSYVWEFELASASAAPVLLETWNASCACTDVTVKPERLLPRHVAVLRIVAPTPGFGVWRGGVLVRASVEGAESTQAQELWFDFGGRVEPHLGLVVAPAKIVLAHGEATAERRVDLFFRGRGESNEPGEVQLRVLGSGQDVVQLGQPIDWKPVERLGGESEDRSWEALAKLRFSRPSDVPLSLELCVGGDWSDEATVLVEWVE